MREKSGSSVAMADDINNPIRIKKNATNFNAVIVWILFIIN
jgi:hypothetical protein